jgi:hypothetical protein
MKSREDVLKFGSKARFIKAAMLGIAVFTSAGCTSRYNSSDPAEIERKLLADVPVSSSKSTLLQTASNRGWKPFGAEYRSDGSPTTFADSGYECMSESGGSVVPMIVAEFWQPFKVTIEAQWILDRKQTVRRVCVRRTTDAL